MKEFLENMLKKIDNGIDLSETELRDLVEYSFEDKDIIYNRWTMTTQSIININGRYFEVIWNQGLTECNESYYPNQPKEVKPITYSKITTYTDYVSLDTDEQEYIRKQTK